MINPYGQHNPLLNGVISLSLDHDVHHTFLSSALQCVVVCDSALQCVAMCVAVCCSRCSMPLLLYDEEQVHSHGGNCFCKKLHCAVFQANRHRPEGL